MILTRSAQVCLLHAVVCEEFLTRPATALNLRLLRFMMVDPGPIGSPGGTMQPGGLLKPTTWSSLANDLDPDCPFPCPGLVEVHKVEPSEFTQDHAAINDRYRL